MNRARDFITYANSISNRDLYLYLSGISEIKEDYKKALTHYKNYHLLSGKLKSTGLDEKVWELVSPLPSEEITSVLCLPFESGEEKGLVGIYHSQSNAYNREDYEILEMLSSYAAIALSNSHQTEIIQQINWGETDRFVRKFKTI